MKQRTIMVVDDDPMIRNLLIQLLTSNQYTVSEAEDGYEALRLIKKSPPDLVLLDLNMPRMNGFEVIQWLRADRETRLIPIIVLTAYGQEKVSALESGADDFIMKPFELAELLARIKVHLRLKEGIENLEDAENVIISLAKLVEARDVYTERHVERVAETSIKIGESLGLGTDELDTLKRGAFLHDIGKIGIRENILNKPGPLTPEERKEMERHPVIGEEVCRPLRTFKDVLPIIRHHHERWDGKGYPDGLKGEEIPLLARIVAIADVLDALTSDRPYRKAWPKEKAHSYIKEQAGSHFDPKLVKVWEETLRVPKSEHGP